MIKSMAGSARAQWKRLRGSIRWEILDKVDKVISGSRLDAMVGSRRLTRTSTGSDIQRLYVDVSVISKHDAGTGIQRVVREVREHLREVTPSGIDIVDLKIGSDLIGYEADAGTEFVGTPGSVFLGLDFSTDSVFRHKGQLIEFRRTGGRLWFILHDLLPLTNPEWFTAASRLKYRRWLRTVAEIADGVICVSKPVAAALADTFDKRFQLADPPKIEVIELGSDVTEAWRVEDAAALPTSECLTAETIRASSIIVGTVEPRKGHRDVLAAFDRLWASGHDVPLIFLGRAGWNISALQRAIQRHPKFGKLLFWLECVDDKQLFACYAQCRLVIVPSLAEGYGLPLDEALALGAHVLARDIAVFRRHAEADIDFFSYDATADEISTHVLQCLAADRNPAPLRLPTWDQTSAQIISAITYC